MSGIAVIVGAGASHDCADSSTGQIDGDLKPPLANQLFENRGRFNQILNRYPGARALSARIRSELAPQTKGLEDILRDIEGDKDVYTRRQYVEVPPYLQELLGDVSHAFIIAGGNYYDTLVADIQHSRYEHFLYITVLACPPQHLDAMTSRLRDCSALLLIGFSALDSHVLEMFELCDKAKTVRFVNESADAGRRALHRCQPHNACFNNLVPDDVIYGLGFARFVRDGRLRDFLRSVA